MKITVSKLREIIREVLTEMNVIQARDARKKAEQSLARTEEDVAENNKRMKEIVAAMVSLDPIKDRAQWKALRAELAKLI
tara:strand:- start:625 stop:864 length:240 start_codon:yes stop_codon:yes gene_type:complete